MSEKLVNVLFKENDQEGNKLQPGTMTLTDLYGEGTHVWVKNACGDDRWISRRNFHIVDLSRPEYAKANAIVCDIDGVLNYIPKKVDGTDNRQLLSVGDGVAQWTELDQTIRANQYEMLFRLLVDFARQGKEIIFLTARGDTQRFHSDRFLQIGLESVLEDDEEIPHYLLFMRGFSANDISAHACKAQMFQACILPNYKVDLFIDDCAKNINAVKEVCPEVPCMHFLP